MVKNTYTQTQEQVLSQTLSPQQLLAVQILELTTVEIEERVRSEVMDNPALESDMPGDVDDAAGDVYETLSADTDDDYSGNDDIPVSVGYCHGNSDAAIGDTLSFGDTLVEQLGELQLSEVEHAVGEYIIGSLDEDGILRKPLSEMADELLVYENLPVGEELLLSVLGKMQKVFEPAGIAARSLQECLLLQLDRSGKGDSVALQRRIVADYYDDFTGKRWEQIAEKLGVEKEELRSAIGEIVRLNPRPGASLAESVGFSRQEIMPDFVVEINDDSVFVSLNNGHLPTLKVNDEYLRMLDEQNAGGNAEQKSAAQFLKQKVDAAKGFINAIQQREHTMLSTMRAIVRRQKAFFLSGGDEACLEPMILEDIAKETGFDVSTISRVSNSKYVQVPWSIYSLKYFFSDGVTKEDGTTQSVYELFRIIRDIVVGEDKKNPLTDQTLQEMLSGLGYNVARRTVAKYREQLGIPVARLRKE